MIGRGIRRFGIVGMFVGVYYLPTGWLLIGPPTGGEWLLAAMTAVESVCTTWVAYRTYQIGAAIEAATRRREP